MAKKALSWMSKITTLLSRSWYVWRVELAVVLFLFLAVCVWFRVLFFPLALWTDDGHFHTARGAQYYLALREGQLPPRWAGNLANGGGSPIFIFAYPLILILHTLIYLVVPGIGFVQAYNWSIVVALLGAAFGMYVLARQRKVAPLLSLLVAGLYVLSPYVLVNVFNRSAAGEIMFLSVLPWTIVAGRWWRALPFSGVRAVVFAVSLALLMLAHQSLLPLGLLVLAVDMWVAYGWNIRSWQQVWWRLLGVGALSGLLVAWFWVPVVMEMSLVRLADLRQEMIAAWFFAPWSQLLAWMPTDRLTTTRIVAPGLAVWLVLIMTLGLRFWRWGRAGVWWAVVVASLFLSSVTSIVIWQWVPITGFIQFPWRLLGVTVLATCLLSIEWLSRAVGRQWWLLGLTTLLLVQAVGYAQPRSSLERKFDYEFLEYHGTTTTFDEYGPRVATRGIGDAQYAPVMMRPLTRGFVDAKRKPITDYGTYTLDQWTGLERRVTVTVPEPSLVVLHTLDYPGWQLQVNGARIESVTDPEFPGHLTAEVSAGTHRIEARFIDDIGYRVWSWRLSVVSWLVVCGYLVWMGRNAVVK